ncbi:MAG: diaminopimelate epimerase [Actinomycetota bacterium]|nr:diaminopimelate epimerase [Actinomycetota bacterium]
MTRFLKGHGTENDFIVLPDFAALDPRSEIPPLSAGQVRRLCDRHAGIGADGVLRVLPVGTATETEQLETGAARWFMDYRNADGSVSEMCGNGARLVGRYLLDAGLETGTSFDLATRGGVRQVMISPYGVVSVDMGPARFGAESVARVSGEELPGRQVSMTNPHLVCVTDIPVDDLDLSQPPGVDDSLFPDGVNIEFVNCAHIGAGTADQGKSATNLTSQGAPESVTGGAVLLVRMRVYERGVGETRSCGTGACAVAAHALDQIGRDAGEVLVDVPGGQVSVTVTPETTVLGGPAVFVAAGELDSSWWAAIPD